MINTLTINNRGERDEHNMTGTTVRMDPLCFIRREEITGGGGDADNVEEEEKLIIIKEKGEGKENGMSWRRQRKVK